MTLPTIDFDGPWKSALDTYLADFLAFFFPQAHADIDWSRGYLPCGASTIEATLDQLFDRYGVSQPLADFLFADPYKVLTERVESGRYVGERKVAGVTCHHLAFRQADIVTIPVHGREK